MVHRTWLALLPLALLAGAMAFEEELADDNLRHPKVLLNLFSFFGEPVCSENGVVKGVCKNELECISKGGKVNTNAMCELKYGYCCEVSKSCGSSSSERIVHWESAKYPSNSPDAGICRFQLKPANNVCYVRIDFLDLALPSKSKDFCTGNSLNIYNMDEGASSPICGALSGISTLAKVKYTSDLKISANAIPLSMVMNTKDAPYKFRMRFTQIKCDEVDTTFRKKREVTNPAPAPAVQDQKMGAQPVDDMTKKADKPAQDTTNADTRIDNKAKDDLCNARSDLASIIEIPRGNIFANAVARTVLTNPERPSSRLNSNVGVQDINDFPFLGYLLLKTEDDYYQFCGITLISSTHFLTSAQCLIAKGYSGTNSIRAFFGELIYDRDDPAAQFVSSDALMITDMVFHPMFDYMNLRYDLVVGTLESAVTYTPANLPAVDADYDGSTGTMVGRGLNQLVTDVDYVPRLNRRPRRLPVEIISNTDCQTEWASALNRAYPDEDYVYDEMVCTESLLADAGFCIGDQGGPLVVEENGGHTLVGIISGGYFNCWGFDTNGIFPDISTRVSMFIDFINAAITETE